MSDPVFALISSLTHQVILLTFIIGSSLKDKPTWETKPNRRLKSSSALNSTQFWLWCHWVDVTVLPHSLLGHDFLKKIFLTHIVNSDYWSLFCILQNFLRPGWCGIDPWLDQIMCKNPGTQSSLSLLFCL